MDELIRRSDAINEIRKESQQLYSMGVIPLATVGAMVDAIVRVPAVKPWELYNPDEWCRDCKEYDTENHRCPRWNRVIRKTLGENIVIDPETIERGSETYIGEDIVVCHHEDYMDMMCKAMMWDEYGEEPKQGEWIEIISDRHRMLKVLKCSNCGEKSHFFVEDKRNFCPNCGARMKGADDEYDK